MTAAGVRRPGGGGGAADSESIADVTAAAGPSGALSPSVYTKHVGHSLSNDEPLPPPPLAGLPGGGGKAADASCETD